MDKRLVDLLRIWAAERMAALPGDGQSSFGIGTGEVREWMWPLLLRALEDAKVENSNTRPDLPTKLGTDRTSTTRGADGALRWMPLIEQTARRYGLEPALLQAVLTVESGGNPSARSPAGALGLMQLMPETARTLGVNPLDPAENLDGGARYLQSLLSRFQGDLTKALAAYNAGPGAVEQYGGIPPYRETREYVQRVRELYSRYRS